MNSHNVLIVTYHMQTPDLPTFFVKKTAEKMCFFLAWISWFGVKSYSSSKNTQEL